jgi:hypothetical protein
MPLNRLCAFVLAVASMTTLAVAQGSTGIINDPTLGNMKAFTVTIPNGWKFQGTVVRGPECNPISSPVYRAYSPDGLTEMRLLPAFNWTFHPGLNMKTVPGCLPIKQTLTAAQFLDHFVELIPGGVHVVGPLPVAAIYRTRTQRFADALNSNNRTPGFHATVDTSALRVQSINGSFIIEQRIRAWVECRTNSQMGAMNGGGCSAHVDVLRAPKGKLDGLIDLVDAHDLTKAVNDPQWLQAYMQRQNQEGQRRLAELTTIEHQQQNMLNKQMNDINATMARNHEAFMQQQESSFRQHEAFLAQQESSFHSSMKNSNDAMNARSTATSDWVDYSLDQQTVTGSGGTVKVSSTYGQTWSNGQNQWFQTNDPNSNPNGVLPGNWTQDTKVHGNGQPY